MPVMIQLSGTNGDIWVNASKILYMKSADGETAIFMEGSGVAIFVKDDLKGIRFKIDQERALITGRN